MKTLEELKKMDVQKLKEELALMQKGWFKSRFDVKTGQSKNSHLIRNHKKQIARIKTILNDKTRKNES